MQREHEGASYELHAENRRLQRELAAAKAREAALEEKLGRCVGAISGLSEFAPK